MAATAARRSARSTAPGVSNGMSAFAMRALARVMRCSIAASLDQEGAGDLPHRQARDDAQRQRDLLRRRQLGMAAHEQQAQHVVAVMRAVEPLGQRRLGIVEVGERLLGRQRILPAAPAHAVQRGVAADQDQPGRRIARRSVARPGFERAQAGLLERLLGRVEVAEIAQQRADRLRPGGGQRRVDPGKLGHAAATAAARRGCRARRGGSRRRRRDWRRRARARRRAPRRDRRHR